MTNLKSVIISLLCFIFQCVIALVVVGLASITLLALMIIELWMKVDWLDLGDKIKRLKVAR